MTIGVFTHLIDLDLKLIWVCPIVITLQYGDILTAACFINGLNIKFGTNIFLMQDQFEFIGMFLFILQEDRSRSIR